MVLSRFTIVAGIIVAAGIAESIFVKIIIIKSTITNSIIVEYIVYRFSLIQNYQRWNLFASIANIFR
jgi:hypothetical protein